MKGPAAVKCDAGTANTYKDAASERRPFFMLLSEDQKGMTVKTQNQDKGKGQGRNLCLSKRTISAAHCRGSCWQQPKIKQQ